MVPSDEVKRIGLCGKTAPCERQKPIKQFTNSLLLQINKTESVSLSQVYFCTFYFQTPSLSIYLPRSLSLLETCLLHTWKPWHGKFTAVRVKRDLNYILLVWTDYQNEQRERERERKHFQPLMELLDICDFPLSDDRCWKF